MTNSESRTASTAHTMAKYLAISASAVLFLTVGMPIWAGYSVSIAVAAWKVGLVRAEFAPQLGHGILVAPILLACAAAVAYGAAILKRGAVGDREGDAAGSESA